MVGFGGWGLQHRVEGLELRDLDLEMEHEGSGFKVDGWGWRDADSGLRVEGRVNTGHELGFGE